MKKLFILLLVLSSCAIQKQAERTVSVNFYDFRKYTEIGFFLSPDPYVGEFKPVGMIDIDIFPGIEKKTVIEYNSIIGDDTKMVRYATEEISGEECLKIIVDKAKKMGANGVSNFKAITHYNTTIVGNATIRKVEKYEVSGFAINIKEL